MKLIVDLPDGIYKFRHEIKGVTKQITNGKETIATILEAIENGIPLDEIKTTIQSAYCNPQNDYDRGRNYGLHLAIQMILDALKRETEMRTVKEVIKELMDKSRFSQNGKMGYECYVKKSLLKEAAIYLQDFIDAAEGEDK